MVTRTNTNRVLRDLRARKGWSQERLARVAGVSLGTINQAERGLRLPTVMTQQRIAEALEVERTLLFPEEAA
jgi:transcriptional regulator with XRE-family HTH domain